MRETRWAHILPQRDHRRDLHRPAWRMDHPVIAIDDVDPFEEHRLDHRLPGPEAEGVIGERRVIGVEDKGRTIGQMAGGILPGATETSRALYQLRLEHGLLSQASIAVSWQDIAGL